MNEKNITVKEKNSKLLLQGMIFLVLSVISLIVALMPYLSAEANKISSAFYAVGGISFAIFFTLFIYLLYKECKPADALVLSSRGFIDTKNVGSDITIDWTNVSSVKLLGQKDMPYLGITLENSDIVIAKMKRKDADRMRTNIEENLPHILIAQNDVRASVKELKDLFVKFVREARILSNENPKRAKNNPFTTDDVLRAFGKLPAEENSKETPTVNDEEIIDPQKDNTPQKPQPVTEKRENSESESAEQQQESYDSDPFYALLQKQAGTPTVSTETEAEKAEYAAPAKIGSEQASQEIDTDDDDMPDNIKELMSRAKSSKISELGKMLNDDTPTSHLQPPKESNASTPSDDEALHIDLSSVLFEEQKVNEDQQILFDLSGEDAQQHTESAPAVKESEKQTKKDDMADTKEYFPDLLVVSDSFDEDDDDDDSDFIIPESIEYKDDE